MRARRFLAAAAVAVTGGSVLGLWTGTAAAAPTELFFSEYVEGTSNNKALELFNGTGSAVDLAAGGYVVQMYFNGATTAGTTVNLTGTVASGDVFVLAQASAAAPVLAQADQTSAASFFNGDDAIVLRKGGATGPVLDVIGQVGFDPGSEWGSDLTSTADNTLRRMPAVTAGDTNPADPFDPAAEWTGFPVDTFDGLGTHSTGGPIDQPAVLTCGGTLSTPRGTAATRTVTGTDPDDTIVDLAVSAPVPTITRTAFTPATADGGTATAEISVAADTPAGSYGVRITSTDAQGGTASCSFTIQVIAPVLSIGEVQGSTLDTENPRTDGSPLAGNNTLYDVRGVITQRTLARTTSGANQFGFFLQSRLGTEDGDPTSSDGIFVFMNTFSSLIGGYVPKVGDEVILRAKVTEFFNLTELTSASLVQVLTSGLDVNTAVAVVDATPPADSAAADFFWERHEGMRVRARAGSVVTGSRDVFASTADSEVWLIDVGDPLVARSDPYTRRVFRDPHPLDNNPDQLFDDGNGQRILLGALGVKWTAGDNTALLPPARGFDTLTADAFGGVYFAFSKYSVQPAAVSFASGVDPSANRPPQPFDRAEELSVATYNVENLYDYRDDPFDGCDFTGNAGCPGVSPPFDYVPASAAAYQARLAVLAHNVVEDLRAPDLILVQEAEDQDICTVTAGALACGTANNADGKPDTLQELALAIAAVGGPVYDTAFDRDGADARGIVAAFLFRTDRVSLPAAAAGDPVLGSSPAVSYRAPGLPYNSDVSNPKVLNAQLPSDVDRSTGVDGSNVYTRAPQVGRFFVRAAPGGTEGFELWALSNHYSSGPDTRVGQRTEQAAYGAAIVAAIQSANPAARVIYGGDLNVYPRPDDPFADHPSDQLGPLYRAGLHNLWDDLVAADPRSAYSYVFQGQAQTLDNLFVTGAFYGDFVEMRAAHINADWAAGDDADGNRGASDHDPQVARFRSRPSLTVADASVVEGSSGTTPLTFTVTVSRPLSQDIVVCAFTADLTAQHGQDYEALLACAALRAGVNQMTFTVQVRGDRRVEPDERFALVVVADPQLVKLVDPVALGTIVNDD